MRGSSETLPQSVFFVFSFYYNAAIKNTISILSSGICHNTAAATCNVGNHLHARLRWVFPQFHNDVNSTEAEKVNVRLCFEMFYGKINDTL